MTINVDSKKYGSFQDSLKSPIHRWFTYPAGYSHNLVRQKLLEYELTPSDLVVDPFLGTGTTSLECKLNAVNSIGIEAHPFVHWVASVKMNFNYNIEILSKDIRSILDIASSKSHLSHNGNFPALIDKCFDESNLQKLSSLKSAIINSSIYPSHIDFMKLALTSTLRIVTTAGSGWPYIAPSKYAKKIVTRDAFTEFEKQCNLMLSDLRQVQLLELIPTNHKLIHGDARKLSQYIPPENIDMILTSPPYLNNYDYADRTRLETYFWGIYNNWSDITREVRDKLIIAATTQVRITSMDSILKCPTIYQLSSEVHNQLSGIIENLSFMRRIKAGKKTYDYMTAGYFEDMIQVIKESFIALKPGGKFILVLGDSAPYGVHIPTEEIIGKLSLAVGFSDYHLELLRTRGDKWAHNPQRHKFPLKESILTITK